MFVFNTFENDSRVLKEALTLTDGGFQVHVLALWKQGLPRFENRNGILIHRLDNLPAYIRLLGKKNVERIKQMLGPKKLARIKQLVFGSLKGKGGAVAGSFSTGQPKKKLGPVKLIASGINKIVLYKSFYNEAETFIKRNRIKADVFHCHDLNTVYIGYKLAKKQQKIYIYDSHELYAYRNRPYLPLKLVQQVEEAFESKMTQQAAAVITVSRSIADHLQRAYQIPRPSLIMNAPSRKKAPKGGTQALRNELKIPAAYRILLYSGGITFGRGLENVIKSLRNQADLCFVMMGYGQDAYKRHLERIAFQYKVADRTKFFGPVPPEDVTAYAGSADIGIAPIENVCLSYYYCAPNKVFEYIQGGLPVVASNFPDLNRIVQQNGIGVTCDIAKPDRISDAVAELRANFQLYSDNVKKVGNKYCWENEEIKLMDLYGELLGGK